MKNKKKSSTSKTILKLLLVVPNILSFIFGFASLVAYEARAAGKSVIAMLVLSVIFAVVLTSIWLCLLALLFLFLVSVHFSTAASMLILLAVNLIFLLIIAWAITRTKKKLLFPITTQQCKRLFTDC